MIFRKTRDLFCYVRQYKISHVFEENYGLVPNVRVPQYGIRQGEKKTFFLSQLFVGKKKGCVVTRHPSVTESFAVGSV